MRVLLVSAKRGQVGNEASSLLATPSSRRLRPRTAMMRALLLIATLLASAAAPASAHPLAQRAAESEVAREAHVGNDCRGQVADGPRCHNGRVLVCVGQRTASYTACVAHEECKHGICEEEACRRKDDGFHCHDGHVVECSMGRAVHTTECGAHEECKSDELRPNAASCQDICRRKSNGTHCEDDSVLACQDGRTVNVSAPSRSSASPALLPAFSAPLARKRIAWERRRGPTACTAASWSAATCRASA